MTKSPLILYFLKSVWQYDIFTSMIELNRIEIAIIEALGDTILTVKELAVKAGYQVSDCFKREKVILEIPVN